MKVKLETSAQLKKNIKGTRREGQRVIEKGTEPCILWAVDEEGPKYRETEAHITLKEGELKITIPSTSQFNYFIKNGLNYHYIATFVTGKMAPLCVSVEPLRDTVDNSEIEYVCKSPYEICEDINKYIKEYRLQKGM